MDSSDITGSKEEECSENEYGWTFYIESPKSDHEDDHNYGEEVYDHNSGEFAYSDEDDGDDKDHKSDDSMASDASSGPSQLPSGTSDYFNHGDYEHQRKCSLGNKSQKQAKNRGERSTKGKKEHALKAAENTASGSHVSKGSKGRKTN